MRVAQLADHLEGVSEKTVDLTLGEIEVEPECRWVSLPGGTYAFDERTERSLANYLGVPTSYLGKCDPELKAYNVNHWLMRRPDAAAVVETVGDSVVSVHKPGLLVVPLSRVVDVITSTMDPDYEVVQLIRDDTRVHVDIITDHHVEVEPDDRIEDRRRGDRTVGDITHGGVRIVTAPTEMRPPQVLTYLHRLWCTNGSTSPAAEGAVRLKGHTVDDVIREMEQACRRVMGELDRKLLEYAELARTRPPGSPSRFAWQLGREYGVGQKIMDRVMERVHLLPEDATLYDIQQIFTELANGSVSYRTMTKLQQLGGDLAFSTEQVTRRCGTCERLLPE